MSYSWTPNQYRASSFATGTANVPQWNAAGTGNAGNSQRQPPAVPPRPRANGGGFSSGYSPYSYSSYSPYGMGMGYNNYSSYGPYGYGGMYGRGMGMYGGYGMGNDPENRFIQLAESSTRPAFESIESLIRAFNGISMMLDSTFFAITSSFRAVLGVAENFGRLRSLFGQFWSSFAICRLFTWFFKKLARMFGFNLADEAGRAAWNEALQSTLSDGTQSPGSRAASWPIFMFLGLIISAPYLISKLIPSNSLNVDDPTTWTEPGMRAQGSYSFQPSSNQELSVQPGQNITIAPRYIQEQLNLINTGWVFAVSDQGKSGIVPLNHVIPVNRESPKENGNVL